MNNNNNNNNNNNKNIEILIKYYLKWNRGTILGPIVCRFISGYIYHLQKHYKTKIKPISTKLKRTLQ